jgi:F-type H+-transporting ATPase subunit a
MKSITDVPQWVVTVDGHPLVFNAETLIMTWIVVGVVVVASIAATRRLRMIPGPVQNAAEMLMLAFQELVTGSLGRLGRKYFPLIVTTFIFILISNWMGMVPGLSEPTKDLNTTLTLGLIGFVVAHVSAIRVKGWRKYLKVYFEPFFLMFPLNVIGELAKVVSISFRLYGNIMGGSIIILVVSDLVNYWVLPPFLQLFFGFFVGTIQAFVFAMLTLTYISLAVQE